MFNVTPTLTLILDPVYSEKKAGPSAGQARARFHCKRSKCQKVYQKRPRIWYTFWHAPGREIIFPTAVPDPQYELICIQPIRATWYEYEWLASSE